MNPLKTLSSRIVTLPNENIDTDQIIPARYLKAIDKAGMGDHLFADWRYDTAGNPKPDFALNQPRARGAQILLAGDNFACGSSREHAVWALTGFGFRAVISTSIADIFRNNALKNGLLPIVVDKATHRDLFDLVAEIPEVELKIDIAAQTLTLPDGHAVSFALDTFSKTCLLKGVDELGYLMAREDAISQYESLVANTI
ncbi:MAG: 3-isopropylmalate dehydratase small subunit [Anaerolineales bacterium]|nr:3-isopropylmalate dehydratase small subunit [Anaerolineales bacterium]